jgi:hypothetical protein
LTTGLDPDLGLEIRAQTAASARISGRCKTHLISGSSAAPGETFVASALALQSPPPSEGIVGQPDKQKSNPWIVSSVPAINKTKEAQPNSSSQFVDDASRRTIGHPSDAGERSLSIGDARRSQYAK